MWKGSREKTWFTALSFLSLSSSPVCARRRSHYLSSQSWHSIIRTQHMLKDTNDQTRCFHKALNALVCLRQRKRWREAVMAKASENQERCRHSRSSHHNFALESPRNVWKYAHFWWFIKHNTRNSNERKKKTLINVFHQNSVLHFKRFPSGKWNYKPQNGIKHLWVICLIKTKA